MARDVDLEIVNFVCRFGDRLVLNDLLEEVVLPAFFSSEPRQYGETQYLFTQQKFTYLEKGNVDSLSLQCRFIKNTVLKRHQVYSPAEGLRTDEKELASAPSALAVLLLKSHRLLFMREVPHAPTPVQYGTTFAHFLRRAVQNYQNSVLRARLNSGTIASKKAIRDEFPFPEIEVVPVVSSESIKQFVKRFEQLRSLKIEIAPTNSELDNTEFFKLLRASKGDISSKKTVVHHLNRDGLDKNNCVAQAEAAKQGNARIEMKGVDANGDQLKGDNENFSVRATIEGAGKEIETLVHDAFERYGQLIEDGVISVGKTEPDPSEKLKDVFKRHEQRGKK